MTLGTCALLVFGTAVGVMVQLNRLAALPDNGDATAASLAGWAVGVAALFGFCRFALRRSVALEGAALARYRRWDWLPFSLFLGVALGAAGIRITPFLWLAMLALFVISRGALVGRMRDGRGAGRDSLSLLFFVSGFAALLYQIVWHRVLFAAVGSNIQSVTLVVAVFMLGLGVGAMVGGYASERFPRALPLLFCIAEIGIGGFGLFSVPLIRAVGDAVASGGPATISSILMGVLLFPTVLMGATLPILVAHRTRESGDLGSSVSEFYLANTLGSALACFATVDFFFANWGLAATTWAAAGCNIAVAFGVGATQLPPRLRRARAAVTAATAATADKAAQ